MSATLTQTLTGRTAILRDQVIKMRSGICLDRARAYTAVYKQHQDKPVILRRALAIEKTLKEMKIFITPGELLVGNHSSALRAAPIYPEYAVEWILNEIDEFDKRPGDTFFIREDQREELIEICRWWEGKTTLEKGRHLMGETLREIHKTTMIKAEGNLTSGDAHIAINAERLLATGIGAYIEEIQERQRGLFDTDLPSIKKRQFYRAAEISMRAVTAHIERYAELAREEAARESEQMRRDELDRIAAVCGHIALAPPRDFYEALQLILFMQLILQIESNGHSMSLGRMDQYLYPFYRRDIDAGNIKEEFAAELLENTWIKLLGVNKIRSWSHTRFSAGGPLYQNVTIGGVDAHGRDAVNDLSYLILRTVGEMKLTQPNLSVRYHKGMSEEFLLECVRVIEKGFGMPAFNNDEIVIDEFIKLGVKEEDARNYSAIGCIEVAVPGKWGYRCTGKHFINFMRVFLAALNDGTDPVSGKRFCPGVGRLEDFSSYDQLLAAWDRQIRYYARAGVAIDAAVDVVLMEEGPDLICSVLVDDCLERGLTIHEGGSVYDFVSGLQVGIANLGNSLAAIKKLVFDEKLLTASELMSAIENDFAGAEGERIRQLLLNAAPKFGNDDDYVDLLLTEAYDCYLDEIKAYRTIRDGKGPIGCRYYGGTSSISANVPSGAVCPATPDGRKAWVPLAEGSSPSAGTDVNGPTSVFKSIGKLPTGKILGGVLLNQKLTPAILATGSNKRKLIQLFRTFFDTLRGWHVQYNVVDRETLLKAQADPEQYRDLVVRVAGYSAFFTTLSPDTQNDIIARTEQEL